MPAIHTRFLPFLLWSLVLQFPLQAAFGNEADIDECLQITAANADQCLRLNHLQVLGSHNSYKLRPRKALIEILDQYRDGWADHILYEHPPLREQLNRQGLRQFELDVYLDTAGGRFANPAGAVLVDDPDLEAIRAALSEPGLKVLHNSDIDYRSHCPTLVACLKELRDWSLANPSHLPVMVLIEMKEQSKAGWGPLEFTSTENFSKDNIYRVDDEIWQVFDQDHVITPDDVRGNMSTLSEAIRERGWPTIADSRGRILFALDNTGSHRDLYLASSPVLQNRALFVSAEPQDPAAAFFKINDVLKDGERIREYVRQGYIVRTRTDIPVVEARTGETERRDKAFNSGAQYLSTDFADPSTFGGDYQVELQHGEAGLIARCNPVSAPPACRDEWLREH